MTVGSGARGSEAELREPSRGSRIPTVLYVDGSIGFGGSSKSLALTLGALPEVRKVLVTAQAIDFARELFGTIPMERLRTRINYRTRALLGEFLSSRVPVPLLRTAIGKAYTGLDVLVMSVNAIRLARIIRKYDVDLVHINNGFRPHEAVLAARRTGTPFIGHLRGFAFPPFPPAVRAKVLEAQCTIGVSEAVSRAVEEGIPEARVTTIYDPVDVDYVRSGAGAREAVREELGVDAEDVLVGIFGRVVRWKGQLEFVRACARALDRHPAIRAAIVGDVSDGSQSYMDEIREAIAASGRADRFILVGYRKDVERVYAALDVAVHASTSPEPFGMVVPEAMAAGKPVIATDAGGPAEIVTDGVDGILVPMGDIDAMRGAIERLAGDQELRETMGLRGSETAALRFGIASHVAAVRALYREVLGSDVYSWEGAPQSIPSSTGGTGESWGEQSGKA